jgi:hypothetical protein
MRPFFRLNITTQDLNYAIAMADLTLPRTWLFQGPSEWFGRVILLLPSLFDGLAAQPYSLQSDAFAFEAQPAPHPDALARFTHVVYEAHPALRPSYLSVGVSTT